MGLLDKFKNLDPMRGLDKAQEVAKKAEEDQKKAASTNIVTTTKPAFNPSAKFGQSDPNIWNKAEYEAWKKSQEKK